MKRRALDRIDELVGDADYRSREQAVADSWRVALFAVHPALRDAHEAHRRDVVERVNGARRSESLRTAQAPTAQSVHRSRLVLRVLFVAAIVLGMLAVALVAISRTGRTALSLNDGMLLAGTLSVLSVAMLWALERKRRSGEIWGSHASARAAMFLGSLWLLFGAGVVVFRLGEVDRHEPHSVVLGLIMFGASGIAALVLWRIGVSSAKTRPAGGKNLIVSGLVDPRDETTLFDALDEWWKGTSRDVITALGDDERQALREAHGAVLAQLRRTILITERDERSASREKIPSQWAEPRGGMPS